MTRHQSKEGSKEPTNLVDLIRIRTVHLNRVGRKFSVKTESIVEMLGDELGIDFPFGEDSVFRFWMGNGGLLV